MVQVTYRGEGDGATSNAASEATLLKLIESMKTMGGAAAGAGVAGLADKAAKKQLKSTNEQTKADGLGTKATKGFTKATKGAVDKLGDFVGALGRAGAGLVGGIFGGLTSAAGGLTGELMGASTNLGAYTSQLTGMLGPLGAPINQLIGAFEGHIDTFRDMASVGAAAGNDLYQFQTKASSAGVTVEMLTGVINTHSKEFAIGMGSTVSGVNKFVGVLGGVQSQFQKTFSNLGIQVQEQMELTAEYMAQEARMGRVRGRSDASLIKGSANYIMELDKLAKLTGISRKEAAAAMRQAAEDPMIKSTLAQMEDTTKTYTQAFFKRIGAISPEIEKGLGSLMVRNGVAHDEFTQGMVANNDSMRQAAQLLHSFSQGVEATPEKQKELERLIQAAGRQATLNGQEMGNQMGLIKSSGSSFYDSEIALMGSFDNFALRVDAVLANQKDQTEGGAEVLSAEKTLINMANVLRDKLKDVVMPKIEAGFNSVTTWLETNGVTKINSAVDTLTGYVDKFAKVFKDSTAGGKTKLEAVWDVTKEVFNTFASKIKKFLGFGGSGADEYTAAAKELVDVNDKIASIKEKMKDTNLSPEELKAYADQLAVLQTRAEGLNTTIAEGKKKEEDGSILGFFKNLHSSEKIAVGILAVGAAVGVLVLAFTFAQPILLAIAAIMGIMYLGSLVVKEIASAISAVGSAIGDVATGLAAVAAVKVNKDLPTFLSNLTVPLIKLAGSAVVMKLIGEGGLKGLADGIKEFQDIKIDALAKAGPALESLYKGVSAFTGDGFMDKAGKFFGGLFGSNNGGMKALAKDLEAFSDVDAAGLQSIGDGLQGLTAFVEAIKDTDLDNVSTKLEKLINNLKEYQKISSNMSSDMTAEFTKTIKATMSDSGSGINQLNSNMQQLLTLVEKGNSIETKQLKVLEER